VLAPGHVFFIDGEAAAQDAAESTLAFSVPDGGAGTSVLNLTERCYLYRGDVLLQDSVAECAR
jgi:hypothetical protein